MRPTAVGSQRRSSTTFSALAVRALLSEGSEDISGSLDGTQVEDLRGRDGELWTGSLLVSGFGEGVEMPRVEADLVVLLSRGSSVA